jgi:CTP:molybdopterin cytidylyltransferase MocA/xanthine/CO dehydrogenase XdhC/CoxF family maturation factor
MEPIYLNFLNKLTVDKPMVLATILQTIGSTPQVPGSSALFASEGRITGTLGGGILEFEVQKTSKDVLKKDKIIMMGFELNAGIQDQAGAICGGHAFILMDAHPEKFKSVFQELKIAYKDRIEGALITTGTKSKSGEWEVSRYWMQRDKPLDNLPVNLRPIQKSIFRSIQEGIPTLVQPADKKSDLTDSESFVFIEPILPPEQLIIVGGGHIGKAVTHQAALLGFEITVIDNRKDPLVRDELPPDVGLVIGDVEKEIRKLTFDHRTFVVIATQGHQYDANALKACIRSGAAYVGLMGSQRKIRLMRQKFIDEGWATAREFDEVHAPIGIRIQSETVSEIAVSIAAELIQVRKELKKKYKIPYVSGMILAAGESKRMKQQKLLMDFHGESFIRTIVRKVSASDADQVMVILGSHSRKISDQIHSFGVDMVFNPLYKEGMLSSIQCGFNTISKNVDAVLVILGDQPMIETETINKLIQRYRKTRDKIIVPVYQGKRGHPVLIDARFKDEIFSLNPEKGLRELMYAHGEDLYEMEVETPGILKDIDTIKDYENEIN